MSDLPVILCADDDDDILALVALRLRRAGYDVRTASDGAAALAAARDDPPAVAILDVMMPRMGGIDVVQAFRDDEALAHVKVVLLSARVQDSDRQRGLDAGADAYLLKPFRFEELEETVAQLLA
ncbi:MAG TPA: response regulator [Gaiellaceae bacterium]|nr:response regulator [Gaiellaceae bacterium]